MNQYESWEATKAFTGEFETLEPGAYVCKIKAVKVEAKPYGELLTIQFDIAEGEQAGFYQRQYEERQKWYGNYYQTFRTDKLGFAKGFIQAIEESNSGFKWNFDEKKLVGKLFAGVFGEEEYLNDKGEIKTSIKCQRVISVPAFREGKFRLPDLKKIKQDSPDNERAGWHPVLDDENENPFK